MKKYKFQNFNVEIINPNVTVVGLDKGNPNISNINFQTMKYTIEIILESNGAKFGLLLDNVQAETLNWGSAQDLNQQVLNRLDDFKVDDSVKI